MHTIYFHFTKKTLELRKVKYLARGHTSARWQSSDLSRSAWDTRCLDVTASARCKSSCEDQPAADTDVLAADLAGSGRTARAPADSVCLSGP